MTDTHADAELAQIINMAVMDALTETELQIVRERNASDEYADCCASHDFIDTNHYALAAFEHLYHREADLTGADLDHVLRALDIVSRTYLTETL